MDCVLPFQQGTVGGRNPTGMDVNVHLHSYRHLWSFMKNYLLYFLGISNLLNHEVVTCMDFVLQDLIIREYFLRELYQLTG